MGDHVGLERLAMEASHGAGSDVAPDGAMADRRNLAEDIQSAIDQHCGVLTKRLCGRIRDYEGRIILAKSVHEEWLLDRHDLEHQIQEAKFEEESLHQEIAGLRAASEKRGVAGGPIIIGGKRSPVKIMQAMAIGGFDAEMEDGPGKLKINRPGFDHWYARAWRFLRDLPPWLFPLRRDLQLIDSRYGFACGGFFRFHRLLLLFSCLQLLFHSPLIVLHLLSLIGRGDYSTPAVVPFCRSVLPCAAFYGAFRRDRLLAACYVGAISISAIALVGLSMLRLAYQDLKCQQEELDERLNPRRWKRIALAAWDFKLAGREDRSNWSSSVANRMRALCADEEEAQTIGLRTAKQRLLLRLRHLFGLLLSVVVIAFAWAFIAVVAVNRRSLAHYVKAPLNLLGDHFVVLAEPLGALLPNFSISLVGAVLPNASKLITSLEARAPHSYAQFCLWRLYLGKICNVFVVVALNAELMAGRPLYRQGRVLLDRDESFECIEDQVAVTLVSLVFSEFVLLLLFKPVTGLLSARATHFAKALFKPAKAFKKPEFEIPDYAVDILYFQCLVWTAAMLMPPLVLLAPMLFYVHFKWLKLTLLQFSSRPLTTETSALAVTLLQLLCVSCLLFLALVCTFALKPLPHAQTCGPFDAGEGPGFVLWSADLPGMATMGEFIVRLRGTPGMFLFIVGAVAVTSIMRWNRTRAHRCVLARLELAVHSKTRAFGAEVQEVERQVDLLRKRLQWHDKRMATS